MSKAPQVSDRTRKRIQEVEKKLLAYEGGADSKLVKEVGPELASHFPFKMPTLNFLTVMIPRRTSWDGF